MIDWTSVLLAIYATALISMVFTMNPVYRVIESLFIGSMAGYLLVINLNNAYQLAVIPLLQQPFLIIPLIIGALMYTRLIRKINWVARYPIAFLVATGLGISMRTIIHSDVVKQIQVTTIALVDSSSGVATFSNIVLVVSVISSLTYFLFTFPAPEKSLIGYTSNMGRKFIMIAFGASIANALMARTSRFLGVVRGYLVTPEGIYTIPIVLLLIAATKYKDIQSKLRSR